MIARAKETFLSFPLYIMSHPFKGFDDMKYQKRAKPAYGVFILIAAWLTSVVNQSSVGFVVSGYYSDSPIINVPYAMLMTYLPIVLFVVSNWSVTSVTNGKGRVADIFYAYAYSLYPYVICILIGTLLSNFVTADEAAFSVFFFTFAIVAQYFYLFIGLIIIHEYTFFRAVVMVLLTVLAMLIIVFVIALFASLVTEVVNFFLTIFEELSAKF